MKYAYIAKNNYGFKTNHLCKAMKVSESGYYRWKKHKVSDHKLRDQYLGSRITSIFNSVKGRYGSPRIRMALKDEGEFVSLRRIQRLMQERELKSPVKHIYKVTTIKERWSHLFGQFFIIPKDKNYLFSCWRKIKENMKKVYKILYTARMY